MNKLFYTTYAKEWLEALPLGNGRLGAMVYGEPFEGRIQMNEESVVYGGPIDRINPDAAKHFQKIRSLIRIVGDAPEPAAVSDIGGIFLSYPARRR